MISMQKALSFHSTFVPDIRDVSAKRPYRFFAVPPEAVSAFGGNDLEKRYASRFQSMKRSPHRQSLKWAATSRFSARLR
jgi:hypothetical protein